MKVWIVTDKDNHIAIYETELIEEHSTGVFVPSYLFPGARTFVKKYDWFKSKSGAMKRAERIRNANIQKLKRAIESLEGQVFE